MLTIIRDFFKDFTRLKLFLIIFCSSLIAILLSFWLGGFVATAVVLIPAILSILQVTKDVWKPEGGGKSTIGLVSLGIAFLAISSNQLWRPFVNSLLKPLTEKYTELVGVLPSESPSIVALIFLAAVILIVNYFARDTTAMKGHSTPLEKEFPEKDYKSLRRAFCGVLLDDLNKIDRETNWSAEIFVPLDAEVEVHSGSKRLKKVTDLLSAIRSDRLSRSFLVLGDPGSGKSVALRKLCRDLLKEVERTDKVPLYINLREWDVKEKWSESTPPTTEQLYEFVINNLKSRGDLFTNEFIDKYFKKMFEHGRLFIVLDSFDEIPAVLDVSENSWLVDRLSDVISRFIAGAHDSRGVLASRIFRKPTDKFNAKTILEIRPFTENKIVEALKKSLFYDDSLIKLLFNERQEFIPIARNPFTAALISSYAKEHNNTLPNTQAELYSSYIQRRLNASAERLEARNITDEQVLRCATEMADVMFTTTSFGLEASIKDLSERLPDLPIPNAIDVLKYARLGRLGAGDQQRFSFVHRRFNEYFVVQKLKEDPSRVPQDDIPTDSRWRDALVLYCGVAEEEKATQIANFCWSEIEKVETQKLDMKDPQYLRAVHCLRFLREAFRARLDCVNYFRSNLAAFILRQVGEGGNLLTKKIAVEAVGLLTPRDIDRVLVITLDINNQWLDEVALKSCHYLPKLSERLTRKLRFFIDAMDIVTFLRRRNELLFSLNLSIIFKDLKRYCNWRTFDSYCFITGIILHIVAIPIMALPIWFYFIYFRKISVSGTSRNIHRLTVVLLNRMILMTLLIIPTVTSIIMFKQPQVVITSYSSFMIWPIDLIRRLQVISMLLLMPWYFVIFSFSDIIPAIRQTKLLTIVKELFNIFLLCLGSVLIVNIVVLFPSTFKVIAISIGIISIACLLYLMTRYLMFRVGDSFKNKGLVDNAYLDRGQIAEQFVKLKTRRGRLKFVSFLRQSGVKPGGSWPMGHIPNVENDDASTLLAQLEEKWLGLDR